MWFNNFTGANALTSKDFCMISNSYDEHCSKYVAQFDPCAKTRGHDLTLTEERSLLDVR